MLEKGIEEGIVEDDDDHILEAERMGIVSNSPRELKGLVKEASLKIERGESLKRGESMVLSKKSSTKSNKRERQIAKDEREKQSDEFDDDQGGSGWT